MVKIAPSILAADFSNLQSALKVCSIGNADYIHIDVMDNHFVPNLTIGPVVVRSLRPVSNIYFDIHLMVNNPENLIVPFSKAGADGITFHFEATDKPDSLIKKIKSLGMDVGISIKPKTPIDVLTPYIDKIDRILIMSVEPGFGGQKFINSSYEKIKNLKKLLIKNSVQKKIEIEVDGGIKINNIKDIIESGANAVVIGSDIFQSSNPEKQLIAFKQINC